MAILWLESYWRWIVIEQKQQQPICRKCGAAIHAKDGNTLNLHQHLRHHHPELLVNITGSSSRHTRESRTLTQPTIDESVSRLTKYARGCPQAKEMTHAITYYLAKDAVRIFTVERAGFKDMVSKLNPRYELPSRKVFFVERNSFSIHRSTKQHNGST